VRISVVFSRVCLLWLICSQVMFTVGLWYVESDYPELFGSRVMGRAYIRLLGLADIGTIALLGLGILLVALYAARERRLGLNTAWALSGIVYTILVFISGVIIWSSLPELYLPPPGLAQYTRVGIVIVLDVVFGIVVRQMIRTRNESSDATRH